MCFLNKFEKKNMYVRIVFRFNKINIDVFFEHLKISFAFEKIFLIIVIKVKMMQSKIKIEMIAKKKIDKREHIKKKIIAKHTCINVKYFKYFKNMCYIEAKKIDIKISLKIISTIKFKIIKLIELLLSRNSLTF